MVDIYFRTLKPEYAQVLLGSGQAATPRDQDPAFVVPALGPSWADNGKLVYAGPRHAPTTTPPTSGASSSSSSSSLGAPTAAVYPTVVHALGFNRPASSGASNGSVPAVDHMSLEAEPHPHASSDDARRGAARPTRRRVFCRLRPTSGARPTFDTGEGKEGDGDMGNGAAGTRAEAGAGQYYPFHTARGLVRTMKLAAWELD